MIVHGASSVWSRAAQTLLLFAVFVFLVTPIAVVVIFSFDANRFPSIPWGGFSLEWHRAIWADDLVIRAFENSIVVSLWTAVAATCIGFAAAYIDYRYSFFGKRSFVLLVAIPPAVPVTILGMAMLAFLSRIGFSGSNFSIVLCHTAVAASFAMAIIRLRLSDLGPEIEPAAWNAGASPLNAVLFVIIPFCRSAIVAAFLLSAAVSFDEFMIAWFVGGTNETIPVRVLNQLLGQVNPKINAIGTVVLLVSFLLILLAQRFFSLKAGRRGEVT